MNLIVTVDENWAIGKGEKQLVQIPAVQRHLQQLTVGGIIVMGRKTLQAMPQGQPLYGRENIILSANKAFSVKGAKTVHGLEELKKELQEELEKTGGREVFVCGGDRVYKQLLPYCDTAYVTMVEKSYAADVYLEDLEKSGEWELVEESDEQTYFDITYYFRKYRRIGGKAEI